MFAADHGRAGQRMRAEPERTGVQTEQKYREKTFGPEADITISGAITLANALNRAGDLEGAETLHRRALAWREKKLGPDHPETIERFNGLGITLLDAKKSAEAEPLFKRGFAAATKTFDWENFTIMSLANSLASILRDREDYAAAERTCGYTAIIGESLDRTARTIHENWLKETRSQIEAARGGGDEALACRHETKATFKVRGELSEEQKGASRSQADHIPFKIRAAGLDPETVTQADWARLSDAQVETLARMEHARWAAYYWMTGWTYAAERDDARKHHPSLVATDELDQPTKDYDRAAVRNLGGYLPG